MPFAATWMYVDIIILSEVSQTNTICCYLYVDSKSKQHKQTHLQNRNRHTDIQIKIIVTNGEVVKG